MVDHRDRSATGERSQTTRRLSRRSVLAGLAATTALGAGAGGSHAQSGDPGEPPCRAGAGEGGTSPPPGPPVLYEPPATAPQFENTGRWQADPLFVSGTDAYVDGEYLYQDYVYDDHGASTAGAGGGGPVVSRKTTGNVQYPTDEETYHYNAADILEVRAAPTAGGIAYRITLNTMTEPDVAAVAIGIDRDRDPETGATDWGYGLGDLGAGVDHVLVTWGEGAVLDGDPVDASVDVEHNRIEVEVPLEPGEETWRHYAVAGLWNADAEEFKRIQDEPSADRPGGANGMDAPPVFNVAFRFEEPMGFVHFDEETPERQLEKVTEYPGSRADAGEYGHWREHAQAKSLADRDLSRFHVDIDFRKLTEAVTERRVPETGYRNRLYASRHAPGAGTDGDLLLGPVQPYALYVPRDYDPDEPAPLLIDLHGNTDTHNALGLRTPGKVRQLGEQRGAFILSPLGRHPADHYYHDASELDIFEALADVAANYSVDFERITIGGHSMGGYGTLKLVSQYPDLFAKAFVTSPASDVHGNYPLSAVSDNLRHVPLLWWHGADDPIVPVAAALNYQQQLREHGYRHELDVFPGMSHNFFHRNDEWGPAGEFLDGATATETPARVTYRAEPELGNEEFGLTADGSYWLSDVVVAEAADTGLVDARSRAVGSAEPLPVDYRGPGSEPHPHVKRGTRWRDEIEHGTPSNALELDLNGVDRLTVWVEDADLDPASSIELSVDTTDPVTVRLESSAGATEIEFDPGGPSGRSVTLCENPGH